MSDSDTRLNVLLADSPVRWLTGTDRPASSRVDWSGGEGQLPLAVARPENAAEAAAILAACDRHRQPVVPQGGMTGLAGAAVPRAEDVAIATDRMVGVEHIDRESGTITLRAGTILSEAQRAVEAEGWLLPIDLGARDSCRVGGCTATNAGGQRVMRYGSTRANLLGIEAALPSGEVVGDLRGQIKDNTGYHLPSLFCGAEGTLGVITRAVVRLHPLPAGRLTALCGLTDFGAVLALLALARKGLPRLSGFEVMWGAHFAFNANLLNARPLSEMPAFAVIVESETDGSTAESEHFQSLLEQAFEAGTIADATLPQNERETRAIWEIREGVGMDDTLPALVNLDISAPASKLGRLAEEARVRLEVALPGITVLIYGHLGDGNLHITASQPGYGPDFAHQVDAVVYPLVAEAGGSISAEHGIGTHKRDWLHLMRTPSELALMRRIKAAFDPNGIMNPGKLLP